MFFVLSPPRRTVLVLVLVLDAPESIGSSVSGNMETASQGISDRFGPGTPFEYE
jgi:hypothetical protein